MFCIILLCNLCFFTLWRRVIYIFVSVVCMDNQLLNFDKSSILFLLKKGPKPLYGCSMPTYIRVRLSRERLKGVCDPVLVKFGVSTCLNIPS